MSAETVYTYLCAAFDAGRDPRLRQVADACGLVEGDVRRAVSALQKCGKLYGKSLIPSDCVVASARPKVRPPQGLPRKHKRCGKREHTIQRDQVIVDFISTYIAANERPPTLNEIREAVGLRSNSTVKRHIDQLVAAGKLRRESRSHRGAWVPPQ
ncbi:MAG: hypothetical protein IPK17_38385 [Chloroflexi bacterium]|uniref:LexA family protein n=1 Tax=Candidatus Flexifilum breve TaxID=3140694 RepID=UPI0031354361|nr:hypothetical protein [Chloroflexota bacterium]